MVIKKNIHCSLIVITLLILGFNTTDGTAQNNSTHNDNILRLGLHVSDMGNLDPHFAAGSQDRAFADMVFNGILRYKPGMAPEIEPDLARHIPQYIIKDTKQIWSISLRHGVMFQSAPDFPGYEMTADDVVFSLQKSADPQFSAYAGGYATWQITKKDRYTVEIEIDEPVSPVLFLPKLANYAGGFIVSKKAIETWGYEKYIQHPIGTGPFEFSTYEEGRKLILHAHHNYFRGKPRLEGVEIYFFPDIAEREKRFLEKELDVFLGSGEKGWSDRTEEIKDIHLDTFGVGEVVELHLNTAKAPLNDIRVRKAIIHALDRQQFIETLSAHVTGPVYSPVPEMFLPGGLSQKEVEDLNLLYTRDIEKARRLLAEAGFPNGFHLDLVTSEKRLYQSLYAVLKTQLAQIGIICDIREVKHSEMHRLVRKEPQAMVLYAAWRPNADCYLTRFFHSDSIVGTGEKPDTNFSHYGAVDALIEDARKEINPEKQISLWKQAQIRILSDAATFPVLYTLQLYARNMGVDYGHPLQSTMALYPQITENTNFVSF